MNRIYIYHHLGLGDHIICHGIVRDYCNHVQNITIYCKKHNYDSVFFMFRDLKNLTIKIMDENFLEEYVNHDPNDVLNIGNIGPNWPGVGVSFDQKFYEQARIKFYKRWNTFKLIRDLDREQILYDKVKPEKDYIFVHEDLKRNFKINDEYLIDKHIIFMERGLTNNIFDYLMLIENAKEVHLIESSMAFILDSLNIVEDNKIFIHRYARKITEFEIPKYKRNWNILVK